MTNDHLNIMNEKIGLYSLTTSYAESQNSNTQFVHVLNKEFVKQGMKVKTITPHTKNLLSDEKIDGVHVKRFRYFPEKYEINSAAISDEVSKTRIGFFKVFVMSVNFFIFTFFECLKEKPDMIHAHWSFPAGYIAYIISKIFKKNFFVTVHGGEISFLKKFNFVRKQVIKGLNNSSLVLVNSTYTKNEMISLGVNSKKIVIQKVPPNFVKFTEDEDNLKKFKEAFVKPSTKIILFVGRLVERKGVEYLIRSIAEISKIDVHLMIVGGGELKDNLISITNSLGLKNRVTFFGKASSNELAMLHQISDVFVCPSIVDSRGITEYLGLVIPEAMKSGLPVVASAVGGIIDTIKNEENGLLVKQKEPKMLAFSIERLLSDNKLRTKLIQNSKKTVEEFNPSVIAKTYYEIFLESQKNQIKK